MTRELKEIGIDKKGLGISLPLNLEGLQDYRAYIPPVKEGFKFPIYNIDARNLPEIKGIAKPFTLALQHPDLPEFLAKLHEKGYRYLVDSSLPLSDARAVHFGYAKSINMPVRGTWLTFVHEFSHFEWNIAMKDLQALCIKQGNKVYWSDVLRGKSSIDGLSDLIIQHPIIKEAIEFVKQTGLGQIPVGFTAVNESIAVKRQIELLQQYGYNTLDGDESLSPREYAAEHQIDDAQEQLNTIDKQEKEGVSGEYADRLQLIKQQLRETRQIAQEDLFFIKNIRNARTAEDAKAKNALTNKLLAIYGARFFVTVGGAAYIAYFVSQNRYEIKDKLNEWFGPNQQPEQIKVFYNEAEKTYVMLAGKDNIIIPIDKTKVDTKSNLMVIPEEVNGRKVVIHFGKAKK